MPCKSICGLDCGNNGRHNTGNSAGGNASGGNNNDSNSNGSGNNASSGAAVSRSLASSAYLSDGLRAESRISSLDLNSVGQRNSGSTGVQNQQYQSEPLPSTGR